MAMEDQPAAAQPSAARHAAIIALEMHLVGSLVAAERRTVAGLPRTIIYNFRRIRPPRLEL